MKTYGDLPEEHAKLVKQLCRMEELLTEYGSKLSPLSISKGLTCIAHDYHAMDMEEEGDRLLRAAEKTCPGYFKGPILVHVDQDRDYYRLVLQLTDTLALETMISLGFEE